ncbi:hypothetical protein RJ55_04438 [Drechmeria coniospora]|nr:hypothetical protein RJ55_04438 [Drechmeria coniospora]
MSRQPRRRSPISLSSTVRRSSLALASARLHVSSAQPARPPHEYRTTATYTACAPTRGHGHAGFLWPPRRRLSVQGCGTGGRETRQVPLAFRPPGRRRWLAGETAATIHSIGAEGPPASLLV